MLVSVSLPPHPGASLAVVHGPHGEASRAPFYKGSARPSIHPRRPKRASFPKASLQLPSMFPLKGGTLPARLAARVRLTALARGSGQGDRAVW